MMSNVYDASAIPVTLPYVRDLFNVSIYIFHVQNENGERNSQKKFCFPEKVTLKLGQGTFSLILSKKISNDQELIQSDPTSCPINQKGNN